MAPAKPESPPCRKGVVTPKRESSPGGGESSLSQWVVDSSGFLSPSSGPALKEVMEMMEGVRTFKWQGRQDEVHFLLSLCMLLSIKGRYEYF